MAVVKLGLLSPSRLTMTVGIMRLIAAHAEASLGGYLCLFSMDAETSRRYSENGLVLVSVGFEK